MGIKTKIDFNLITETYEIHVFVSNFAKITGTVLNLDKSLIGKVFDLITKHYLTEHKVYILNNHSSI